MNSYPTEMLVQLAPVMFVAGLDFPSIPTSVAPSATSKESALPSPSTSLVISQDPFAVLITRLREVLLSQRQPAIWSPERTKTFQVILVDKTVVFSPRKSVPPDDPSFPNAHSPLSPLTPTSPVYPDGLIAPIWIRKHTSYVPSVFVLFLKMSEAPNGSLRSPLDLPNPDAERERADEEKKKDTELSAEIALRKRSTGDRGIKLTVVLIATRKMLDDPSLDGRLSYIRRQSGLDSRATLFVLSPVSPSELNEFVQSLQDTLYDPAIEYYTSHSKRVRRKRTKHSQALPYSTASLTSALRPLRPEGWTVRYQYKMAVFAEFRGEDEVALKHYQDAYAALMVMFGSTAILSPRTKRWAEAKVLADTISIKITKLYLYNNEHALALSNHNSHIHRLSDLSRGWGISEETFEYWSWMARQHRVLAELLEQGSRSSLVFPTFAPTPKGPPGPAATLGPGDVIIEQDVGRSMGLNPSCALHHPGHYYYLSARCTEARKERFLECEDAVSGANIPPGYANEKKVDHLTMILELYTKSYELFKQHGSSASQGRLTLWIAYRIAHTYCDSGKFAMAIRFFERIAKTYRQERWNALLRPLFATWYACAQKSGDVELAVKLLVEMIAHGDRDELGGLYDDLLVLLKSSAPSSTDRQVVVDLQECEPIWNTSLVFWNSEVRVGEDATFQLSLIIPPNSNIPSLPVECITITFSDDYLPIILQHNSSESLEPVRLVYVGQACPVGILDRSAAVAANLRWLPGDIMVISGAISSMSHKVLSISRLVITLKEGSWTLRINHSPHATRETTSIPPRWLSSLNPPRFLLIDGEDRDRVVFRHRPHVISVSFSHTQPALLDEEYPVTVKITNHDDRCLHVILDVLLQPSEMDAAAQYIIYNNHRSSSLIKGIQCGIVAPGVSVVKTLALISSGVAGDRTLDISIQTTTVPIAVESHTLEQTPSPSSTSTPAVDETNEILRTLLIPVASAFSISHDVDYLRPLQPLQLIADLSMFEDDLWDASGEVIVTTKIDFMAQCELKVECIELLRQNNNHARVVQSSLEEISDSLFPADCSTGDSFCDTCRISLALDECEDNKREPLIGPGEYIVTWRRVISSGNYGPHSSTRFTLPVLYPLQDNLVALLNVPSTAKLHVPFQMHLIIRNKDPIRCAIVTVSLEPHVQDAFVISGLRSGRLPLILPGAEEKITWNLIPLDCGIVKVPNVRAVDHRKSPPASDDAPATDAEGEPVRLIDTRFECDAASRDPASQDSFLVDTTILVLP